VRLAEPFQERRAEVITGSVRIDGAAADATRVLVVSGDAQRLLGSALTEPDGSFAVAVDERPVHLVVKLQGPLIGIVTTRLDPDHDEATPIDVAIDTTSGRFHPVTGHFTGQPRPPFVLLSIDPVRLDGVNPELGRFFNRRDQRVVEASFFSAQVTGSQFELVAQAGQYRIRAGYVVKARPVLPETPVDVVVAKVVLADGEVDLAGDAASGFDLYVTGPARLRLTLAPTHP